MQFGVHFTNYRPEGAPEPALELAQQAEELGFVSVWAGDHIVDPEHTDTVYPHSPPGVRRTGQVGGGMPDPAVLLAMMAARTKSIRVGFDVIIVPYREPLPSAKTIATLDNLSDGRVIVGIGIGWHEQEFEALGVPFNARGSRTDETVEIWRKVWTGKNVSHTGKHWSFKPLRMLPAPAQPDGPPLWMGGDGKLARRRAARFCQAWVPAFHSPERYAHDIAEIRELAAQYGRPTPLAAIQRPTRFTETTYQPAEEELTNPYRNLVGTPDQIRGYLRQYQRAGVEHFVVRPLGEPGEIGEFMETWHREIMPAFR